MKKMITICVIVSIIVIYIIINFFIPVKYSVTVENIAEKRSYIIIEYIGASDEYWNIIDYSDDLKNFFDKNYDALKNTLIEGNDPDVFHYESRIIFENKFVCYGKYTDITNMPELGLKNFIFKVEDWDILYPIKRSVGFLSKKYLCNADFSKI